MGAAETPVDIWKRPAQCILGLVFKWKDDTKLELTKADVEKASVKMMQPAREHIWLNTIQGWTGERKAATFWFAILP